MAAAFFLTWATEALEVVIAAPVALAILALVEGAPEYALEILLAYRQQGTLAAASMTGANRLLLGLGWPLIFVVAFVERPAEWGAFRDSTRRPALGHDRVFVRRLGLRVRDRAQALAGDSRR